MKIDSHPRMHAIMHYMHGRTTDAGLGFFRFSTKTGIATWIAIVIVCGTIGIAIAASVSDSFTDSSKIASSTNLTVDTVNGQVKLAISSSWTCGDALVDTRDSKSYDTVLIGTQCWMAENLNVGTLTAGTNNQGTDCPSAAAIEKYCYSNSEASCTTYGAFYQWNQAMCGSTTAGSTGICPTGWHVPTDTEQHTLDAYLATGTCNAARSGSYDCSPAGTSLKSGGASGFQGLLAGHRATNGTFAGQGTFDYFWSSTESSTNAWYRNLNSGQTGVPRNADTKAYGFSIRCLKD